jgi:hydroquinone 1,2-dioxygenase/2,6-dichloro-p-hydroquinone 1,2-dioxygenase/glyoxalase family protein
MFEATKSLGFKMDEEEAKLGTELKMSPELAPSRDEVLALMERDDPIHV